MKTPEILENIEKVQFDDISHYEDFKFLSDEDFAKLEVVEEIDTNPRRDYLGTRYTFHNKEDDRYFMVEFYGDDRGHEMYQFHEVERQVEIKEVVSFHKI